MRRSDDWLVLYWLFSVPKYILLRDENQSITLAKYRFFYVEV